MAQRIGLHHGLIRNTDDSGATLVAEKCYPPGPTGAAPTSASTPQFHQYANVFPLLDGEEFDTLAESIKRSGIREKIVLHEGKILDGRNRYRAAVRAGLDVAAIPSRVFDAEKEGDPADFVWDAKPRRSP
jgi:hypothetical protein